MLKVFILLPFILTFFFATNIFTKNPPHLRRLAKFIHLSLFIFSAYLLIVFPEDECILFGFNFLINKTNLNYILIINLAFFLFSLFSKNFIDKLHKLYYATNFLLLALINFSLFSDNIFIFLFSLFWIFLTKYLLSISFSLKKSEKNIEKDFLCDILCLILGLGLIIKEFARYFIINDLDFSFFNIVNSLYRIDDVSILYAFIGFLIILCRLLKLIPFDTAKISTANSFITTTNNFTMLVLGCNLFIKCYLNFDYLFYQYQDEISIFLLFNFIINICICLSQKKTFNFINSITIINLIIAIFSTFSFSKESIPIFIFSTIVLFLSFCFVSFIFIFLEKEFKTDDIENFKKINDTTKLTQFFAISSMLNFAPIPLTALFYATGSNFLILFSTKYENEIISFVPYILIFGYLLYSISIYTFMHKTIIEPTEKSNNIITLSNHQKVVCFILLFLLIFFCAILQIFLNFTQSL